MNRLSFLSVGVMLVLLPPSLMSGCDESEAAGGEPDEYDPPPPPPGSSASVPYENCVEQVINLVDYPPPWPMEKLWSLACEIDPTATQRPILDELFMVDEFSFTVDASRFGEDIYGLVLADTGNLILPAELDFEIDSTHTYFISRQGANILRTSHEFHFFDDVTGEPSFGNMEYPTFIMFVDEEGPRVTSSAGLEEGRPVVIDGVLGLYTHFTWDEYGPSRRSHPNNQYGLIEVFGRGLSGRRIPWALGGGQGVAGLEDIIAHEMGHALGLGHDVYQNDGRYSDVPVMTSTYALGQDLYTNTEVEDMLSWMYNWGSLPGGESR